MADGKTTWSAADINALSSCATYSFCSISMVLANKTMLSKVGCPVCAARLSRVTTQRWD